MLIRIRKKGCESIVFPVISTGIFNYPAHKAVELLSEKLIDYISDNPQTRIKRVIFVADDDSIANIWTKVLKYKANIKNMIIQSNKSYFASSWYWKDDEANWKAFASDLNEILEIKF